MITLNGIVGLSLLVGALKHHLAVFNPEGAGSALATVVALATLTLVLPRFTTSDAGPGVLVRAAGLRGRRLAGALRACSCSPRPSGTATSSCRSTTDDGTIDATTAHADPPTDRAALVSLGLLVRRAGRAWSAWRRSSRPRSRTPSTAVGFPHSFVGVVIALLVLLPETIAAVAHAARNEVQTSLNLAYGSAMASIGLTIPAIAVASIWLDGPLALGLEPDPDRAAARSR